MPYCENCGCQINPDAKFCRNCGAAIDKSPVNAQPNTLQTPMSPSPIPLPVQNVGVQNLSQIQPATQVAEAGSEPVLGAIIFKKPKSLGRWDTFTGVVTGQRLIFAQMTSEMLKAAAQQSRDQAKAKGKGFFGQWVDQLKGTFGYAKKYLTMSPQVILAETPGNFALDNNTISEIKLKERLIRQDQQIYEFEVQIHSTAGKYEYIMDQNGDYINLLKQVYGERVKIPFGHFSKTVNIKF